MRPALAIAFGALVACAAPGADPSPVPVCGPLETLAPRPDRCAAGELDGFSNELWKPMREHARSVLVRVELDEASRVRAVCVEEGPGYGSSSARRALSERLDAIRAVSPGPACAAGRRLDLNRYEAKWAEVHAREVRCQEQTRVTRETHGETRIRDRETGGAYGAYDREYEHCMEYEADWIVVDERGSTRPRIYVKPEVPDPPGPPASETASRCFRKSNGLEKRAECIEADGWERLEPPAR